MCAGADMGQGRGSQKESSCSSCCPAQLHPLCSASRPWSWVGFACCCSPRACEEQAAVLLVLAFPASHLLLAPGAVGMAAERVICEHWRLLQCFSTVPYCLCFAATTACKCKSTGLFFKIVTADRFSSSRLFLALKKTVSLPEN